MDLTPDILIAIARPGDKVSARFPAGMKLVRGKAVPEYKERAGRCVIARAAPGTLVLNLGGKYGTPGCVTAENIVGLHIAAEEFDRRVSEFLERAKS